MKLRIAKKVIHRPWRYRQDTFRRACRRYRKLSRGDSTEFSLAVVRARIQLRLLTSSMHELAEQAATCGAQLQTLRDDIYLATT